MGEEFLRYCFSFLEKNRCIYCHRVLYVTIFPGAVKPREAMERMAGAAACLPGYNCVGFEPF